MGYYMYETIQCPFCGEHHAHITYEENRLYQLNCTECHNAIFHKDCSWDNAVKFFKGLFIVENVFLDKYKDIVGCTNFQLSSEDIQKALKQMETADEAIGCIVKWAIDNQINNNGCFGCIYEDADGSTEDISNCVCCSRMNDIAKNDHYKAKRGEQNV